MSSGSCNKSAVLLCLVATQQQYVVDAQKLKVNQFVLNVLNGGSATDDMRLHGDVVTLLDGCCNGDGAGAAALAQTFELPVGQFAVDVFRMVGGDIDEIRFQPSHLINVSKQFCGA